MRGGGGKNTWIKAQMRNGMKLSPLTTMAKVTNALHSWIAVLSPFSAICTLHAPRRVLLCKSRANGKTKCPTPQCQIPPSPFPIRPPPSTPTWFWQWRAQWSNSAPRQSNTPTLCTQSVPPIPRRRPSLWSVHKPEKCQQTLVSYPFQSFWGRLSPGRPLYLLPATNWKCRRMNSLQMANSLPLVFLFPFLSHKFIRIKGNYHFHFYLWGKKAFSEESERIQFINWV